MKTMFTLLALSLVACGPDYDHTDISNVKGGAMDLSHLEVTEGGVTKAHIVVYDDHKDVMALVPRSTNPAVIEVQGIINKDDYAFIGLKSGHAQIQLVADDTVVVTIEADVVTQTPLP